MTKGGGAQGLLNKHWNLNGIRSKSIISYILYIFISGKYLCIETCISTSLIPLASKL